MKRLVRRAASETLSRGCVRPQVPTILSPSCLPASNGSQSACAFGLHRGALEKLVDTLAVPSYVHCRVSCAGSALALHGQ